MVGNAKAAGPAAASDVRPSVPKCTQSAVVGRIPAAVASTSCPIEREKPLLAVPWPARAARRADGVRSPSSACDARCRRAGHHCRRAKTT